MRTFSAALDRLLDFFFFRRQRLFGGFSLSGFFGSIDYLAGHGMWGVCENWVENFGRICLATGVGDALTVVWLNPTETGHLQAR